MVASNSPSSDTLIPAIRPNINEHKRVSTVSQKSLHNLQSKVIGESKRLTEMRAVLLDELNALIRLLPEFEKSIHRRCDNKVGPRVDRSRE